jgi:hypothetical protein
MDECKKISVALVDFQECRQPLSIRYGSRQGSQVALQNGYQLLLKGVAVLIDAVVHPNTFAAVFHPAGIFEVGQMSGNGRLWELEYLHQVADAEFTCHEERENTQAGFVGQRFIKLHGLFHRVYYIRMEGYSQGLITENPEELHQAVDCQ